MDERRKHRRKLVNSRVRIFHASFGSLDTQTRDISDGGVLLLANKGLPVSIANSELKLIFLDSGDVDVVFNTNIVRINDSGIGLEFLNYEKEGEVYPISNLRDIWDKPK